MVTNSTGAVVEDTTYEPFGAVFSGGESRYLYTGKELDRSTGLEYYVARYYDPSLGQFAQPDSALPSPYDPQQLNRYAYARNNPYKYTDPTGHFTCDALAGCSSTDILDPWGLGQQVLQTTGLWDQYRQTGLIKDVPNKEIEFKNQWVNAAGMFLANAPVALESLASTVSSSLRTSASLGNLARGRANEAKTLLAENLQKNTQAFEVKLPNTGRSVRTIPDSTGIGNTRVVDIKDVKYVTNTQQLQAQAELARQRGVAPEIITGPLTRISRAVERGFKIIRRAWLGPQR